MDRNEILAHLSLEEKAGLCSGADFWHLKGVERLGLRPIMVTDGPHGLRKQAGDSDHLGIFDSVPATCFPTAAATANTFDVELLEEIGVAMGEEALQEQVSVILGPAVNLKRSPLCGRNFEYISEDPYTTGKLAAALIKGIQSQGVGVSVKHFAANSQEARRFVSNSVVDDRALRELYLTGFEIAVKEAKPWTLMCSYNLINDVYASENYWLLTQVLRDEWGFEGLVMTDWGATNDRVGGVLAGLDLEMPSSGGQNDARIVSAVRTGAISEADVDRVAGRVIDLILASQAALQPDFHYDGAAHHQLARRAAAASCVLLKNDADVLPLDPSVRIGLIGALAQTPRYQGAGSSRINPARLDNALDEFTSRGCHIDFAPGYSLEPGSGPDDKLISQACEVAKACDVAVIFAGLPDEYESEGFDRTSLFMPESHNRLITAVAQANPNTVVVLQLGAPVVLPWQDQVRAILVPYLGGQAGGSGVVDVLLGQAEPGGRLAETWPLHLSDVPCHNWYPAHHFGAEYRESIFVGYRYFDTAEVEVAYPFGFGLGYTTFEYSELNLPSEPSDLAETLNVSCRITNTGTRRGSEIVQVYVGRPDSVLMRPLRELKAFVKVTLDPGASQVITAPLDRRSFAYFHAPSQSWAVEGGEYRIEVGSSSRAIQLSGMVNIPGDGLEQELAALREQAPAYFQLGKPSLLIPTADFEALYGRPLPPEPPRTPYTVNSTLDDIKSTVLGKILIRAVQQQAAAMFAGGAELERMASAMLMELPLRGLAMMSGGALTLDRLAGLIDLLNRKPLAALQQLRR